MIVSVSAILALGRWRKEGQIISASLAYMKHEILSPKKKFSMHIYINIKLKGHPSGKYLFFSANFLILITALIIEDLLLFLLFVFLS